LRAGLVGRAEDWKWGSLHQRTRYARDPLLADWPLPQPSDWAEYVNLPQTEAEIEAIRRCLHRGSPYSDASWTEQTAEQLGLQSTLRRRGRPRKGNTP
jgi:putative transposase